MPSMPTAEITIAATQEVAPLNTGDMLAGVLQAARDKSVDPDKLGALIGLAERMQDRSAREQFYRALNAAQCAMPRIAKRGVIVNHKTGKEQNRYARLEDIDREIRPIYEEHGFAVTFPGAQLVGGKHVFSARVMHSAGHVEEYTMPLALDTSGSKNETQGAGSTMSYARRYLLKSIFNIIEEGEDTDGTSTQLLSDDQVLHLRDLCRESGGAEARFAGIYGVATLEAIPAAMYRAAVSVLEQRKAVKR